MTYAGLQASTDGDLKYNNVPFLGASTVTVSREPIRDDADRTTIFHEIKLTVSGVITANENGTTDDTLEEIREKLSQDGKRLVFKDRGFGGDLDVGPGGKKQDLHFGPKVNLVTWKPVGSAQACMFTWEVTVRIAERSQKHDVVAINYTHSFDIRDGFTTRTIAGYIQVAQRLSTAGNIFRHADHYRERLIAVKPANYKREHTWTTSADKSRVDFTIVDTQIESPEPYPVGVLEAKAQSNLNFQTRESANRRVKLSLDIKRAPDQPRGIGWNHFLYLVNRRIELMVRAGTAIPTVKFGAFLESLNVQESIFGYDETYSCTVRLTTKIAYHIDTTAMFTPIGFNTWEQWSNSLINTANHTRGNSKLDPRKSDDKIVNVMESTDRITIDDGLKLPPITPGGYNAPLIANPPPPESSWEKFTLTPVLERTTDVSQQSYIQSPGDAAEGGTQDMNKTSSAGSFPQSSGVLDTIQTAGQPSYKLTLYGKAVRVGYEIPRYHPPQLNGKTPVETYYAESHNKAYTNAFGIVKYRKEWVGHYLLTGSPGDIDFATNPGEQIKNGKAASLS